MITRESPATHWTTDDAQVLAEAELEAQRGAAVLRLGVAVAVVTLLSILAIVLDRMDHWVNAIGATNLVLAAASVVVTRIGIVRKQITWLLAVIDVAFVLCIGMTGPWFEVLPPGLRSALVSPWAFFLVLAIASVGSHAGALILQTIMLTVGFSLLIWWPDNGLTSPLESHQVIAPLFSDGSNVVRVAMVTLVGIVMAAGAVRSRRVLKEAIRTARERSTLKRFLPTEVNHHIVSTDFAALRRGRRHRVSVLFADIKGFTSVSENLEPERVASLLTSFRTRAERVVERHGGVIDKFTGDGLLAVFGLRGPSVSDAANAVAAAESLKQEIHHWGRKREREGRSRLDIGIGIHCGQTFVGALGKVRMEYTVIGDAVNVAQRLEELTRVFDSGIIASADVLSAAGVTATSRSEWTRLPDFKLRGRTSPIEAYSRGTISGTIPHEGNDPKCIPATKDFEVVCAPKPQSGAYWPAVISDGPSHGS